MIRRLNAAGMAELRAFLATKAAPSFQQSHRVIPTRILDRPETQELLSQLPATGREGNGEVGLIEHEKIWFPTYPGEWPPEMLHAAARLTLDLAEELLAEGICLKDATPHNILFRGPQAVFTDVGSFQRRVRGNSTWLAYAQFVRTFLLPLLVNRHLGIPLNQIFASHRDGLEPEEVYRWSGFWRRLRPPFLGLATLPTWLAPRAPQEQGRLYAPRLLANEEKAEYVLQAMFAQLGRQLAHAEQRNRNDSYWSSYENTRTYTEKQFQEKTAFVNSTLAECRPQAVLDVGCNTGYFSKLAAAAGARVVAVDADPVVVGKLWRSAAEERLDILPLAVDLGRPTPPLGWCNEEEISFLHRCRGEFDLLLLLAILHHLAVRENVPVGKILDLAAALTTSWALIEYVGKEDPMFRAMARGRSHLYEYLTREFFEGACAQHFEIVRSVGLSGMDRCLYLLHKRSKGGGSD